MATRKATPKATPTPVKPATANAHLDAFRRSAQEQSERIPSMSVILYQGQWIAGRVLRKGIYFDAEYGNSPVLVFNPEDQDTNVAATFDGTPVADIEAGTALVLVCLGTILAKCRAIRTKDLVYVERHDDGTNAAGQTYKNYSVMVARDGVEPEPIDELIERTSLASELPGQGQLKALTDRVAKALAGANEEPF